MYTTEGGKKLHGVGGNLVWGGMEMINTLDNNPLGYLIRDSRNAIINRLCMKYQKELQLVNISIKVRKKIFL